MINIGRNTDDVAFDALEKSAKLEQAEQEARAAQREAERKERMALEEDLRGRAWRSIGTRDVTLNSDGSKAKVGDNDWVSVEELKRNLK